MASRLKTRGTDNPFQTKTETELAALRGELDVMRLRQGNLDKRITYIESLAKGNNPHYQDNEYDDFIVRRDPEYSNYRVYGPNGEHLPQLSDVTWMTIEQAKTAGKNFMKTGRI